MLNKIELHMTYNYPNLFELLQMRVFTTTTTKPYSQNRGIGLVSYYLQRTNWGSFTYFKKKVIKKKKKVITEVSCQSNKFTEAPNLLIHLASSQSSKLCVSCNLKKKKKIIWKLWNNLYTYLDCQFHKSPRSTQIHIYQPEQQFHS